MTIQHVQQKFLKNRTIFELANAGFVTHSIKAAIEIAEQNNEKECFIIGGGEIYRQSLEEKLVDRMYITHIKSSFEGDTFFPKVDWSKWNKRNIFSHIADSENPHNFDVVCYER